MTVIQPDFLTSARLCNRPGYHSSMSFHRFHQSLQWKVFIRVFIRVSSPDVNIKKSQEFPSFAGKLFLPTSSDLLVYDKWLADWDSPVEIRRLMLLIFGPFLAADCATDRARELNPGASTLSFPYRPSYRPSKRSRSITVPVASP